MKTSKLKLIDICHLLSAIYFSAFAQGTAFTYQGRLNSGGNAANGVYDFPFTIYDDDTTDTAQGSIVPQNATIVSCWSPQVSLRRQKGVHFHQNPWR